MEVHQKQAVQVFRRIRDHLGQYVPAVAYTGTIERLVEQLTGVVTRLEMLAREQGARTSMAQAGTALKRELVARLRWEYLRPISQAAKALFPFDHALLRTFAMPRARDYEGTIVAAEAMAQNAATHRELFVKVGFPRDFVESLQNAAQELRLGVDARAANFGKRSASTAGIRQEYARGRDIVRLLDAMVAPRLRADPERLAEWRSLSRFEVQRRGGQGQSGEEVALVRLVESDGIAA
jgi:hypothetical protein